MKIGPIKCPKHWKKTWPSVGSNGVQRYNCVGLVNKLLSFLIPALLTSRPYNPIGQGEGRVSCACSSYKSLRGEEIKQCLSWWMRVGARSSVPSCNLSLSLCFVLIREPRRLRTIQQLAFTAAIPPTLNTIIQINRLSDTLYLSAFEMLPTSE